MALLYLFLSLPNDFVTTTKHRTATVLRSTKRREKSITQELAAASGASN